MEIIDLTGDDSREDSTEQRIRRLMQEREQRRREQIVREKHMASMFRNSKPRRKIRQ
tara:strand:- start:108 stop:278 length:171 start_codon:yes stop_codon:yes gene_type:complete